MRPPGPTDAVSQGHLADRFRQLAGLLEVGAHQAVGNA